MIKFAERTAQIREPLRAERRRGEIRTDPIFLPTAANQPVFRSRDELL